MMTMAEDEVDYPMIKVSRKELLTWANHFEGWWSLSFLKKLGTLIIMDQIKYLWRLKGKVKMPDVSNGFLMSCSQSSEFFQ